MKNCIPTNQSKERHKPAKLTQKEVGILNTLWGERISKLGNS